MGLNERSEFFESTLFLFVLFVIGYFFTGCNEKAADNKSKFQSPPGYDLNHPFEIKLPLELDEISGVVYYPKDTSVMAINDEYGFLYKIYFNHPGTIQKWKFSNGADFEDLSLIDSTFFVLQSNGNIMSFKVISSDSLYFLESRFPFGNGNEFEIFYYDSTLQKIVMICKDCEADNKQSSSVYFFDPRTFSYTTGTFAIDVLSIGKLSKEGKFKFKPSAAAINPVTDELFIISAVNEMLVVADRTGKPKEVYHIDHKIYKQPEGLSFTTNGSLIISNEAADVGVANILLIPYYKQKAQAK